jgi:hypothetical protein
MQTCFRRTSLPQPVLTQLQPATGQHVRERQRRLVGIPRPLPASLPTRPTRLSIPQNYQCPHQPGHRRRTLHRQGGLHLRVMKTQPLLGIAERHFDLPVMMPPKVEVGRPDLPATEP